MLSTKHLFAALERHPDRPSESTVKRWVEGKQQMPSWALDEVARLLGITKDAAPEGAAETLLKLWTGTEAPAWAQTLTDQVLNAIAEERQVVVDAAILRAVEIAERRLFGDNIDEDDPPPPDPPPAPGAGPRAPKA